MSDESREPLVSVIVVTLEGVDLLRQCLDGLSRQDYGRREVIVVDNGSRADIRGILHGDFRDVVWIRNAQNAGFAGGNNAGIRAARGEWIALVNNDAVPDPGWLSAMVGRAASGTSIGAVACKVADGNRRGTLDSFGVGTWYDGMSRQAMRGRPETGASAPMEVLAFSGCACMIRVSALRETGPFDEAFFAYCEDTDLSLRLRRAGWSIAAEPAARVTHFYSKTGGSFSLQKVFWVERNHFWVACKNYPLALVAMLPAFTLRRFVGQWQMLRERDSDLGRFLENSSPARIRKTVLSAHARALRKMPAMLRARSFSPDRLGEAGMWRLLRKHMLPLDEILGRGLQPSTEVQRCR